MPLPVAPCLVTWLSLLNIGSSDTMKEQICCKSLQLLHIRLSAKNWHFYPRYDSLHPNERGGINSDCTLELMIPGICRHISQHFIAICSSSPEARMGSLLEKLSLKIQRFPANLYIHHIYSMPQTCGEKDLILWQTGPGQHTGASTVQQLGFYIIYTFYNQHTLCDLVKAKFISSAY